MITKSIIASLLGYFVRSNSDCKRCCEGPYIYSTGCNGMEGVGSTFTFTRTDIVLAEMFQFKLIPNPLCYRSTQHQTNYFDILGLSYKSDCSYGDLVALNYSMSSFSPKYQQRYDLSHPEAEHISSQAEYESSIAIPPNISTDFRHGIYHDLKALGFPTDFVDESIRHYELNMPFQRGLFYAALDYMLIHDVAPSFENNVAVNVSDDENSFVGPIGDPRPSYLQKLYRPVNKENMDDIWNAWNYCEDPKPFLDSLSLRRTPFFDLWYLLFEAKQSGSTTVTLPSVYLNHSHGLGWKRRRYDVDEHANVTLTLAHTVVILDKAVVNIDALQQHQMCTRKFARHHYWTLLNDIIRHNPNSYGSPNRQQSYSPFLESLNDFWSPMGGAKESSNLSSPLFTLPHFTRERGAYLFDRSKLIVAVHYRFGDIGGTKNNRINEQHQDDRMLRMSDLASTLRELLLNPESVLHHVNNSSESSEKDDHFSEMKSDYDQLLVQVHVFVELAKDFSVSDISSLFSPILAVDPSIYFHVGSDRNTVTHIDHMIASDVFIASPSSFSLFIAPLNKHGVLIYPSSRAEVYAGLDNAVNAADLIERRDVTAFNRALCSDAFPLYTSRDVKKKLCSIEHD